MGPLHNQARYYWPAARKIMVKLTFQERLAIMIQGGKLDNNIIYPSIGIFSKGCWVVEK